jgi:hypothetical protein
MQQVMQMTDLMELDGLHPSPPVQKTKIAMLGEVCVLSYDFRSI